MQFHATYDPKKYIATFLAQHYKGHSVQIVQGCCRKCLKHGQPIICNLSTHPWSRLLSDGTIDPYQTAGVFYPGSQFHNAHFKKPLLDLKAPELPCKYPGTCELTCLLCNNYIDGPGIELKDWPGFKVHAQCTTKCQSLGCHRRLPDFPAYISYQRSHFMCEEHQLAKGMQGLSLGAITPTLVSQARKEVKEHPTAPKPVPLPAPKSALKSPALQTPEKRPEMQNPPVKKTVQFKQPTRRAKADKYDGDRSKCIKDFFRSPAQAIKELIPQPDAAPRRFIRNKQGVIYAYWKGDCAHCIDTDTMLFRSNSASGRRVSAPRCKLDFSPPERITPEAMTTKTTTKPTHPTTAAP